MKANRLSMAIPLLASLPVSLIYRYFSIRLSLRGGSWYQVAAVNASALVLVLYNIRQGKLVRYKDYPLWLWILSVAILMVTATAEVILP